MTASAERWCAAAASLSADPTAGPRPAAGSYRPFVPPVARSPNPPAAPAPPVQLKSNQSIKILNLVSKWQWRFIFFCSRECDKVPRKKSTASSWKKLGFGIPRKERRRRNSKWNYSNHFPSPEEIQNWSSRIKLKNFFKKSLPTSRIANNPISSHQQSESKNLKIYRFFFLLRYF